jgi:hypothetical protein
MAEDNGAALAEYLIPKPDNESRYRSFIESR